MTRNQQVVLAKRPSGMAQADDFDLITSAVPELQDGEVRLGVQYISLDPAMRGWMNAGTTYIKGVEIGAVMRAFAAGQVLDSRHPDFQVGDYVSGLLGVQTIATVAGKSLSKINLQDEPLSWHLGILGMPGMTAYFGLLDRGQPQAGETVFVAGAAGIVGSTVGQIARIKGCRVIGTAGTAEKCRYLEEECGFDLAINYKTQDVSEVLREHYPEGVHIVYDNVGGPLLDTLLTHLARGARVIICGAISQYNKPELYGPKNYMKIVTARGILTGVIVFDYLDRYPEAVAEMTRWLQSGQLKTKEDIVSGIEHFPATLQQLFTGQNFGKLLIQV